MADNTLSEYELLRLRNIKRNHEFLKSLGKYLRIRCFPIHSPKNCPIDDPFCQNYLGFYFVAFLDGL